MSVTESSLLGKWRRRLHRQRTLPVILFLGLCCAVLFFALNRPSPYILGACSFYHDSGHRPKRHISVFEGTTRSDPSEVIDQRKPPLILFWNPYWKWKDFALGADERVTPLQKCSHSCEVTTDKTMLRTSSAIVSHMPNGGLNEAYLYRMRQSWQNFVFFVVEPPWIAEDYQRFHNLYNVTMTYRSDSDVPVYYTEFKKLDKPVDIPHTNYAKGRNKYIFWLVSKCNTISKRENYVKRLEKYIPVDIFGKCGRHCDNCEGELSKFKFYLSMENSNCFDYMTEKVRRAYLSNTIPIVLGGAKYADRLPPNSFIDVANFSSPKEMADYLYKVAADDALYNSFFEYKKWYRLESSYTTSDWFCRLCEFLVHNETRQHQVYTDIHDWYHKDTCCAPEKFYPKLGEYFADPPPMTPPD